jgi:hypothetical protein
MPPEDEEDPLVATPATPWTGEGPDPAAEFLSRYPELREEIERVTRHYVGMPLTPEVVAGVQHDLDEMIEDQLEAVMDRADLDAARGPGPGDPGFSGVFGSSGAAMMSIVPSWNMMATSIYMPNPPVIDSRSQEGDLRTFFVQFSVVRTQPEGWVISHPLPHNTPQTAKSHSEYVSRLVQAKSIEEAFKIAREQSEKGPEREWVKSAPAFCRLARAKDKADWGLTVLLCDCPMCVAKRAEEDRIQRAKAAREEFLRSRPLRYLRTMDLDD